MSGRRRPCDRKCSEAGRPRTSGVRMYKPGQGYWTRMVTAVAAGLIAFLGASWVWETVAGTKIGTIPPVYVSAGAALLVLAIFVPLIYYFIAVKPRTVD